MNTEEKKALIRATWTPKVGDIVRLPAGRRIFKIVYMGSTQCIISRWVHHYSTKGLIRVWTSLDDRTLFFDSYLFKGLRPVIE